MKIAIVHDWLNTKVGGAERLLLELLKLYPEADLYTLIYDSSKFDKLIDPKRVHASWLNRLPESLKRHQKWLLTLIPKAITDFDLSDYDLVISYSSGWSGGVTTGSNTLHLTYSNSPMRFAWDYWPRYLTELTNNPLLRFLVNWQVSRIRLWDFYGSKRTERFAVISQTVGNRIKKYYRREAEVIYPPVDTTSFKPVPNDKKQGYYLIVSTLARYKAIYLAIEAFNQNGHALVIAGEGADRERLEGLAKPNIKFVGWVGDTHKAELMARAKALVFPGEEDFGITPVEAMAAGTPVIAYGHGGLSETVIDGETGVFFDQATTESLNDAVKRLDTIKIDPVKLSTRAERFSTSKFKSSFTNWVEQEYKQWRHQNQRHRVRLLGVEIDPITNRQAIDRIAVWANTGPARIVVKPYVEFIDRAYSEPALAKVINSADLVVPDGVALNWGAHYLYNGRRTRWRWFWTLSEIVLRPKHLKRPLPDRAAGINLTWPLLERCQQDGLKLFLVGSPRRKPIAHTAQTIQKLLPRLHIVGTFHGRVGESDYEKQLFEAIKASRPDVVLIGLGFPIQERMMLSLRNQLDHGVLIGEGGSFDYAAFGGHRPKAPKILQRLGLEWLWRLTLEPTRLRRQLAIPRFMHRVYVSGQAPD